jgi:uncharacterized protein DUF6152
MRLILSLSLLLSFPLQLSAHHSRHEFACSQGRCPNDQELTGEIAQVMWFNPHAALMLKVTDESGKEQLWRIETFGGPQGFARFGITGDLFHVGERVTVAGAPSTLRRSYFLGTNALLADGTEVILGASGRRWNGAVVGLGYGAGPRVDEEKLKGAAQENRGIFRVWTTPSQGPRRHDPFTREALAAREKFDVANNPLARCEQPGMPVTMMQPTSFRFIDEGETLKLHAVYMDTVRTIHLAGAGNPDDQPATHLGYSVGRWEGRTLVVETMKINHPYFDIRGTPQSPSVKTVERFTLSQDQSRLDYHLTIIDPPTFTEPATYERYLLALDEPFAAMDCKVF